MRNGSMSIFCISKKTSPWLSTKRGGQHQDVSVLPGKLSVSIFGIPSNSFGSHIPWGSKAFIFYIIHVHLYIYMYIYVIYNIHIYIYWEGICLGKDYMFLFRLR